MECMVLTDLNTERRHRFFTIGSKHWSRPQGQLDPVVLSVHCLTLFEKASFCLMYQTLWQLTTSQTHRGNGMCYLSLRVVDSPSFCYSLFRKMFACFCYALSFLGFFPFQHSEQRPKRLPVARSHGVIHKDVERRIDVGEWFCDPKTRQVEIVVATSNVHLRQKEPEKTK